MDFFKPQLDYLEELLYVRYRLASEDIQKMSEYELRNIIINRDEKLVQKAIYSNYDRNQKDISKQSSEKVIIKNTDLLEQLFGNVKASADNREVERTVTITIRDKYLDSPPNVKTS